MMRAPRWRTWARATGAAGFLLGATAPASAEFLFESKGTQPGDIPTNIFKAPTDDCRVCHERGEPAAPVPYRAYTTWAGTMMANALRDPLYLAAVAVAEADIPAQGAGPTGIGEWCVRCHSPVAFVKGNTSPLDDAKWTNVELQGVGCDVCHRSTVDPALTGDVDAPHIGNAQLYLDPGLAQRGPYPDFVDASAHPGKFDAFTSSSELCGQCHEVSNPLVGLKNAEGIDTSIPFPLDTTYAEWKGSAFASGSEAEKKTCADCHMPRLEGEYSVAGGPVVNNPPQRPDPARHLFAGGNRWGIDAVAYANPEYAKANAESFDLARGAAEAMLRASAKLEPLAAPSGALAAGAPVAFGVRVTNLSGHKFPTGYADGRRAFLQVGFVDSTGREVVLSGRYENDDLVAEGDPQLRLYEAVHASSEGAAVEGHLAKYDTVVRDSRIPPAGFQGADVTKPVGVTWFDAEGGGYHEYDEVSYALTLPSAFTDGPGRAFVRLVYQPTTKHYVELLEQANAGKNQRGQKLRETWEATGKAAPFVVAEFTSDVVLSGGTLPAPGAGGAGGVAGGGGGVGGVGGTAFGQAGAGGDNAASPGANVSGGGCSCEFGPRGLDARGALLAAGLVALALGASRRRSW